MQVKINFKPSGTVDNDSPRVLITAMSIPQTAKIAL